MNSMEQIEMSITDRFIEYKETGKESLFPYEGIKGIVVNMYAYLKTSYPLDDLIQDVVVKLLDPNLVLDKKKGNIKNYIEFMVRNMNINYNKKSSREILLEDSSIVL